MVLAYARQAQEQWAEMLPLTQELIKAFPDSVRAFNLAVSGYAALKQYGDWQKLVDARMQQHPDELAYVRSSASLAAYQGDFTKARDILKGLIDKGKATSDDLNQYAWEALMVPDGVDQAALDAAQRGSELTKNSNFAILHTLACLDAQAGKTSQARELLLKAMDAAHMEEPNSAIWFGFASIAEQYGVFDAAKKMYSRVEKPKRNFPSDTYIIAQQRLGALRGKVSPLERVQHDRAKHPPTKPLIDASHTCYR
jgi:tetratricopeptide (TPR) repeat protein